jgi:hypothetical protein
MRTISRMIPLENIGVTLLCKCDAYRAGNSYFIGSNTISDIYRKLAKNGLRQGYGMRYKVTSGSLAARRALQVAFFLEPALF